MKMTRCSSCPCRNGPRDSFCVRVCEEEGGHAVVPCTLNLLTIGVVA